MNYDVNTEAAQDKEVSYTPETNDNIRLGNTVNPEPTMGAGEYNFAKSTPLDAKTSAGVIGTPTIGEGYGMPAMNSNVDITNSDTTLNTTASNENLSKKFKYPQVSQTYPAKDGPSQFTDHS